MRFALLMTAGLVLLVAACGGGRQADFYPLAAGNTWEYRTSWAKVQEGRGDTTVGSSTVRVTVVGAAQLASGLEATALARHTSYYNRTEAARAAGDTVMWVDDTLYLRHDGARLLRWRRTTVEKPDTLLVLPLAAGSRWNIIRGSRLWMVDSVIGRDAVTVPAGTWPDAWRLVVTTGAKGQLFTDWWVEGIGLVRSEMVVEGDSGQTMTQLEELVSYKVK